MPTYSCYVFSIRLYLHMLSINPFSIGDGGAGRRGEGWGREFMCVLSILLLGELLYGDYLQKLLGPGHRESQVQLV